MSQRSWVRSPPRAFLPHQIKSIYSNHFKVIISPNFLPVNMNKTAIIMSPATLGKTWNVSSIRFNSILTFSASCIFIISAGTVAISLIETRRQSQALHDMVAQSNDLVSLNFSTTMDSFQAWTYKFVNTSVFQHRLLSLVILKSIRQCLLVKVLCI